MSTAGHAQASNQYVIQHLITHGFPALTLEVTTEPGDRWVRPVVRTVVRNSDRSTIWAQHTVDRLRAALRALPGSPYTHCSGIRDRFVIIWDGV